jgi:hypothetical protein
MDRKVVAVAAVLMVGFASAAAAQNPFGALIDRAIQMQQQQQQQLNQRNCSPRVSSVGLTV